MPDKITRHLNPRKCILNMSGVCDRHFLYLNKIKVYSSLTTALQSFLSFKSRVLLNVTFSGPKIQNHINSISTCQVLIVSKIWCCWFCEWICKPPNVPLRGFSQRSHTYMPLGAREVMYKSETDWVQYKTQWWPWSHLESKYPTHNCCPAPATRCLEGMPASHSQVHNFSKTVWKFRYLCKCPVL